MLFRTCLDRTYSILVRESFIAYQELLIFSSKDIVRDHSQIHFVSEMPTESQQQCTLSTAYGATYANSESSFLPVPVLVAWHVAHGELARVLHNLVSMSMLIGCAMIVAMAV